MNYVWHLIICAQQQGIAMDELRFIQEKPMSPYKELSFENINEQCLSMRTIEVNALYRYAAVFEPLLADDMETYAQLRDALFDILTHRLAVLDLRQGLMRQSYREDFLGADYGKGCFGQKNADAFASFTAVQRRSILVNLIRLYHTGPSLFLLRMAVKCVFPQAIVYAKYDSAKELLFYVGHAKTEQLLRQVQFMCDSFLSLDYDVELFWETHFGIVGVSETMMPGDIMLF